MNLAGLSCLLTLLCCKMSLANRTMSLLADEIRSLSELPLDELIHIKSTLKFPRERVQEGGEDEEISGRTFSMTVPVAESLRRNGKKPMRRYEDHSYEEKGKDTKISKIFQLSVTALSFLAFGGYLLMLIITAIRQNSGNNSNGNLIVLSNLQGLQNYNRPKREAFIVDPTENNFEIEKLYRGMILLSKSYAMHK